MFDSEKMSNRDIVLDAANLINNKGLAKHTRLDHDGSMCVHGAICFALTGSTSGCIEREIEITRKIAKVMKIPSYNGALATWNNHEDRTKKEVVETLRKAAELI